MCSCACFALQAEIGHRDELQQQKLEAAVFCCQEIRLMYCCVLEAATLRQTLKVKEAEEV